MKGQGKIKYQHIVKVYCLFIIQCKITYSPYCKTQQACLGKVKMDFFVQTKQILCSLNFPTQTINANVVPFVKLLFKSAL